MGLFAKPKGISYATTAQTSAAKEKNDTAKAKARLLETKGENKGAELQAQEGRTVRKVFG